MVAPMGVSMKQPDERSHWANFKRDVWEDPTIRPIAALLLTGLATLIGFLTHEYARLAATREGVISAETGWSTITVVAVVTLVAAIEPAVMRRIRDAWHRSGQRAFLRWPAPLQLAAGGAAAFIGAFGKIPSVAWSLADYLFARVIAWIAGATERGKIRRYAQLLIVWFGLLGLALLAMQRGAPGVGLALTGAGFAIVLAVVRRWSWFEADRDTYLIERGGRRDDTPSETLATQRQQTDAALAGASLAVTIVGALAINAAMPLPLIAWLGVATLAILFGLFLASALQRRDADGAESALRIGFREDLRDEALVSLLFLFALVPLTLELVQQASCGAGACAFIPNPPTGEIPTDPVQRTLAWLGFFGAELYKTAPFVDWSEVFHVANDAPIQPAEGEGVTPLGAQVVFVMRAALDLLLLATVLQAVGIASRLREQESAFRNNQLPILEPFAESRELARARQDMALELDLAPATQHSIVTFPNYEAKRLKELIAGEDETPQDLIKARPAVREAAAALLAAQHKGEDTDRFLFDRVKDTNTDADLRKWLGAVASGVAPAQSTHTEEQRAKLNERLFDPIAAAPVRAAAARRLGRLPADAESVRLLNACLTQADGADLGVGADAAVALVKLTPQDAALEANIRALITRLNAQAQHWSGAIVGERAFPVMGAAYALHRLGGKDIADAFIAPLRPIAARAAAIQIAPMSHADAASAAIADEMDQMVRIEPGSFLMGTPENAESDPEIQKFVRAEHPQRKIKVDRPFGIGRFPVTNREFAAFTATTGRAPLAKADRTHHPAVDVNWHDANAYAHWLERITGERYRLPSEAEWEYACRAGTATKFWWGAAGHKDEWDAKWGNLQDPNIGTTNEVTRYPPNPWGMWDMFGNVYEWCADQWRPTNADRENAEVWFASAENDLPHRRVVRGGSWSFPPPKRVRSAAYRNEQSSTYVGTQYGFRLARTLDD